MDSINVISRSGRAPVSVEIVRGDGRRVMYQRADAPAQPADGPETGAATSIGRDTGFGPVAREGLFQARADARVAEVPAPQADRSDAAVVPSSDADKGALTPEQEAMVDELAARDREVRRHEEAHARVGGQYAGQPSYTFQVGPDGKDYAIGGEVPIDIAPVAGDPEATIAKMAVVKRAALAPAEPSGQDRRVAAMADAQSLAAQAELRAQQRTEAAEASAGLLESVDRLRAGTEAEPGQIFSIAA